MKLKIAYDISQLATNFYRPHNTTGIIRVIEELLCELTRIPELDLKTVGVCTDNPPFTSFVAEHYLRQLDSALSPGFVETYASRLGIEKAYAKFYASLMDSGVAKNMHAGTVTARAFRLMLMALSYAQMADIRQSLAHENFDIFHSPFLKLPPRFITGSAERLITIYDLIPAKKPEYTTMHFHLFFQNILNSIDIKRDWAICISEFTKMEFCEYTKMPTHRVFVSPLAASAAFHPVNDGDVVAQTCSKYGIPAGRYFLSLALLQPRKNLDFLIRCFIRFLEESKVQDVYLVLAGSQGWKYKDIFKSIARLEQHHDRIIFTSFIADNDLAAVYSGATAFLFPSLYEGFGLPPLEAMQCGVPVISSNTTSLPEVLGDAGILIDPTNEDELCQAMIAITKDGNLRRALRLKGLERAGTFSWPKTADVTVNVYKHVMTHREA